MRPHRSRPAWLNAVQLSRARSRPIRLLRVAAALLAVGATGVVFASLTPVSAVAPGEGIVVYSDGSTSNPWVRDWDGSAWSNRYNSTDVHEWRVAAGAASEFRDEIIAVGVNVHHDIRGMMWDGSSWTEFPFGTLDSVTQSYWWGQDVAYEQSGDAVLVWTTGSTGSGSVAYRVWNGASWTAEATVPMPSTSGLARQLNLAASPDSDEMVLVVSDEFSVDRAFVWDGATWGNHIDLTASGNGDDRTDVFAAYEQQSGDALVVYGDGSTDLRYRTWNGSAWGAEGSFPLAAPPSGLGNVRWTTMAADPGSDRLAVGVTTFSADAWLAVWDGSSFTASTLLTQDVPTMIAPTLGVAFEAQSGDVVALYGESSSMVRYRTWSAAGGFSSQLGAFDVGDTPNSMTLDADPSSDHLMAMVQNNDADLTAVRWDGSSWGSALEIEDSTNEVKNQPWVYLWGVYDPALAYVVTNGNDSGPGSLRDKITLSNGSGSIDTITFSGDFTIDLVTELPDITDQMTIDATGRTVTIDGTAIPVTGDDREGFDVHSDGVTIRGVEVRGFDVGVEVEAIGTTLDGLIVHSNNTDGITISTEGAVVVNSVIGLDRSGSVAGNADDGIQIFGGAYKTTIGGSGQGNVISGNVGDGVHLEGVGTDGTFIQGNFIGTDSSGTLARANGGHGIRLLNGPTDSRIGGVAAGEGNTIAFNGLAGVYLESDARATHRIRGNDIHSNGELGIALEWNGTGYDVPLPNDVGDGDGGPNNGQNHPIPLSAVVDDGTLSWSASLDSNAGTFDLDLFFSSSGDPSGYGEGASYLGSAQSAPASNIAGTLNASLLAGDGVFTMTATSASGDTSEFSPWIDIEWHPEFDQDLGDRTDNENTTVSLAAGASDVDGPSLNYSATGLPTGLSIDPGSGLISGTIDFTAAASSPYSVTVTVQDPTGHTDVDTFTWTVQNVNRGPNVVHPGHQTFDEGDVVSLLMSATDPDGDDFTWSATGLPPGLTVDPVSGLVSGTLPFTAAAGSVYNSTITATDDGSPTASGAALVNWTINDVNQPPVIVDPGDQTDSEGDVVSLALSATDPDGHGITWSATGLPGGLSIDPGSGVISGTLTFTSSGFHPVTFRATDDGSPSAFSEVSFTWDVAEVNRAPVVTEPGDQSDAEGDSMTLALVGSDPDGDDLTWTATGLPGGLSIDAGSGVISGTIDFSASVGSPFSVTVRATDDGSPNLFTEVSFSWTVADTNRAPVVTDPGDQSDAEGDSVTLAVVGSDLDGDDLAWTATGLPNGLSIDPDSGVISGSVDFSASVGSPFSVTVRATDDGSPNLFTEVSFSWTVADTNRAPVVTDPGDQSHGEGSAQSLAIVGSDPDGDDLAWTATGLPGGLSIDAGSGVISGTIDFDSSGSHSVTVRATDDGSPNLFTEVSFTWDIANTNRAPVVNDPGDQTNDEGSVVSVQVAASDPDGDDIGFVATGLPPGLTIDSGSGEITGTLGYSLESSYTVTITVVDNGTPPASAQVSFTWNIGEVNRAPSISALPDRSDEQFASVTFAAIASDPDPGDTLSWSAGGLPTGVAIDSGDGTIAGAPSAAGAFTVTVNVTDDGTPNLSDQTVLTWTVVPPPGFPVIEAIENQESLLGDTVSLSPVGWHPDGLSITWSAEGLPPGLAIDSANGLIDGTPTTSGAHSVVVAITDSRDQRVEASFSWRIVDPDLPPTATDDVVQVQIDAIGSGVAVDVIGNDSDPEGGVLSLLSTGTPEVGTVSMVDGFVVFSPPQGWLGTVSFTYTVVDAAGNAATAWLTITVEESLEEQLAAAALQWDPGSQPAIDLAEIALDPGEGTELVLGSVVQSLYVLRLPLALLGGAVFWSLVLGGILNLGFVLHGGIPRVVRRTSRNVAIVMVSHGMKLEAMTEPGSSKPIHRYLATERGLEATGRRADTPTGEWAEVNTPNGHGWVPASNLTEEVDKQGFAEDPGPMTLLREFVRRLRSRGDIADLVSDHGIAISHHGPVERYRADQVARVMDDPTVKTWKGRNPAYHDFRGTFDLAVATSFLDAWDHPRRQLIHDAPSVPSAVVPVEFTNFHFISVGADVHGPERLDLPAWSVVFSYEGGRARIIGLVKEG